MKCTSCGKEFKKEEIKEELCKTCLEWDIKQKNFESLAKPFIEFINNNYHPHASVIIDSTHAEVLEGVMVISTDEFVKD